MEEECSSQANPTQDSREEDDPEEDGRSQADSPEEDGRSQDSREEDGQTPLGRAALNEDARLGRPIDIFERTGNRLVGWIVDVHGGLIDPRKKRNWTLRMTPGCSIGKGTSQHTEIAA